MVETDGKGNAPLQALPAGYELLSGSAERSVDEKGRIVLPAGPWRDAFGAKAWIGPFKGGSLVLWTERSFGQALSEIAAQETARALPDGSIEHFRRANPQATIDAQGRLTLPPPLRELRNIELSSQVFLEGQGDRLEIRRLETANRLSADEYDALMDLFDHR